MHKFSYKVVPAPRSPLRIKGVRDSESRFALTLEGVFNEMAADGWEYHGAERLTAERRGWFGRRVEEQTVLIFQRAEASAREEPAAERELPRRSPFTQRFSAQPALRHATPAVGGAERGGGEGTKPGRSGPRD